MKKIFLLAAALALSACGFHLKGHSGIPDALPYQAWHVDGESLQQALEAALRRADGKPVSAPQAQATISVLRVDTKKDVFTITRAAEINEYLLNLRVDAQASRNGEPLGEPMTVVVQRTMEYADSEVSSMPFTSACRSRYGFSDSGLIWAAMVNGATLS